MKILNCQASLVTIWHGQCTSGYYEVYSNVAQVAEVE
jgi:hypothetical protein